ncbi:hypothetical protein [Devosia aurantiaca]|uniref:Uncharacterized protein n=1 Tax=Devosia aurantiaca TaxID=2714858 RepID=A0A6M1SV64_9HYPH|nr:hypothetical protein [Devosia aurantiaca]NGP19282.1 hypothetical protein [Devosia aurantiaca]
MKLWPFSRSPSINAVLVDDVPAAPVPDEEIEYQRDVAGLALQRESILTAQIAGQIQETLAAGVLLELRGGRT